MILGAIDIGSNAARLLICDVINNGSTKPEFSKLNLLRVPLRLGFDVFENGRISPFKEEMIIKTMLAYKNLMDVYNVNSYKAIATSAMRDAENAGSIIQKVFSETGIRIEVISGDQEAAVIYQTDIIENLDRDLFYLYIDVGGGSTELTFFTESQIEFKKSFNIGTIRLLKNQVSSSQWDEMKDFIKEKTRSQKKIMAIGSGGNINKVFSMSKRKDGKPLPILLLKDYYSELNSVSLHDRMILYKLKEDRADVILPALHIYINVMRWANADEIYVPKIGLVDGIIHQLYNESRSGVKI
ncbi:MAG: exopolyphosphatase [Chitinophagaceae bacterium]|nr:exopolyphosphatase [Chitinophagaceae bacterium]